MKEFLRVLFIKKPENFKNFFKNDLYYGEADKTPYKNFQVLTLKA